MAATLTSEEEAVVLRLTKTVGIWANILAEASWGTTILVLCGADPVRGHLTVTYRIVSQLQVKLINLFGEVEHDNHGFAYYTPFMRDALEVIGNELGIPSLLHDRSDLKIIGCFEAEKAFKRWGERLDYTVHYPNWWGIAEHQTHAYAVLSDALVDFMSEDDFASFIHEQRSAWAKDWWAAHPEKRDEMSQQMLDWWAAHPEKREEYSKRMQVLEAACAPGSCSFLHADPEWQQRFREASSKRWAEDVDYRAKMHELLRRERPKMKATMLL